MKNYKTNFDAQVDGANYAAILQVMNANDPIGGGGGGLNRKDVFQLTNLDVFTPERQQNDPNPPRHTLLAVTTDGRRLGMRQFAGLKYSDEFADAEQFATPTTVAQSIEFLETAKSWWFLVLDRESTNRTARNGQTFARTVMRLMAWKHEPTKDEVNAAVTAALAE